MVGITPSSGERPERQDSPTADIFRVTLDPGTVITYIAELRTDKLPQLYLWEPDSYKDRSIPSRSITALSSALPDCSRSFSLFCSW